MYGSTLVHICEFRLTLRASEGTNSNELMLNSICMVQRM
jgi:hypothetical protein